MSKFKKMIKNKKDNEKNIEHIIGIKHTIDSKKSIGFFSLSFITKKPVCC